MKPLFRSTFSLIIFLILACSQQALAQQLFLFGHFEIHIDYELSPSDPDSGWNFSVSYDSDNDFNDQDGITRSDPDDLILYATSNTEFSIPSTLPRFGATGDPFWVLPQSNISGTLFLGQRTVADQGLFQTSVNGAFRPSTLGNIILDLDSVEGSGSDNGGFFAVWETRQFGVEEFHFDDSDGIDGNDHLEPVQIGGHTHYNWGMTKPGTYKATFKASGKLNPQHGDHETSAEQTYTFVVPFSNTVPSGSELRIGLASGNSLAALFNADEQVEYAPEQVALLTSSTTQGATTLPYSFLLNVTTGQPAAANRIGIESSTSLAYSSEYTPASKPYEIVDVKGPGTLTLIDEGNENVLLSFSEAGIYSLELRVLGQNVADNTSVAGEAFNLIILAGLSPDYSYAAWAESYEKTHALTSGALSDVDADFDNDRISNRTEFLLFWHGFDPAVADSALLPTKGSSEAFASFFLDTYKDDFSSFSSNSTPRYSDIWAETTTPRGIFDPGQQQGDAYGRLLHVSKLSDTLLSTDKSVQSIQFSSIDNRTLADGPLQLQASSTSGLAIQFEVTGPAKVEANNMLVIEGSGSITVRATQPGNETYFAATPVEYTFTVFDELSSQAIQYFSTNALPNAAGWIQLEFSLGWVNINHFPWVYHPTMGWLYSRGDSIKSAWLWDTELNWLWTTDSTFPWLWSHELNAWLYYQDSSSEPRWFYNNATKAWFNP